MYEPKYKLNKRDAERFHLLLTRHCLEAPNKTAAQRRLAKKYPPLTPEERIEFEKLDRKRSRKVCSHPKVKASIRRTAYMNRKAMRALAALQAALRKLKIKVD